MSAFETQSFFVTAAVALDKFKVFVGAALKFRFAVIVLEDEFFSSVVFNFVSLKEI